jgi:transcriptional regulator with XRE-family HTH domain
MNRRGLADFLRDRRARVRPEDVGLTPGPRRRIPGLRREEVAHLAGMSVDYYIRLEQARGPHPSRQILGSLARALRLSDDEREYIFNLAIDHCLVKGPPQDVPAAILHLLDRMDDTPAFVVDAKYDILAWNPLAAALIADFGALPQRERNAIRWSFTGDPSEESVREADLWSFCADSVADLRAASARYPDDAGLHELIAEMRAASTLFRKLWETREVRSRSATRKRINHPVVGEIDVHCDVLLVPDRDQKVVLYTAAPGTPSYEALRLLRVVGVEEMTYGKSRRLVP